MSTVLFHHMIFIIMGAVKCIHLLEWAMLNCSQPGLRCRANNCPGEPWTVSTEDAPTSPFSVTGKPDIRMDEAGHLVPVLVVEWTTRADGSIRAVKGAEVRVRELESNRSVCLQYLFLDQIKRITNPRGEKWSFSVDRVAVQPLHKYVISVSHLPNPDRGHINNIKIITMPDCNDMTLQKAKFCVESGSLWKPNISWDISGCPAVVNVGFTTEELSEKYLVTLRCSAGTWTPEMAWKGNQTYLNVSFPVGQWLRPCCDLVKIQPFFPGCKANCTPHERRLEICDKCPPIKAVGIYYVLIPVVLGFVMACGLLGFVLYRSRQEGPFVKEAHSQDCSCNHSFTATEQGQQHFVKNPRKILIIYSLDHALYKDIVLKLSAFLRAKCGVDVVLDLLDTAWLGTVGRMQWLDWQKQHIEKSSNKILILCSRGVQAKWRAMCGEPQVILREDVRSPMGDMLTPAFSLIVPDLLHPVVFGKYMVAYFDDICSEDDVPPPFNITIKYKLMKHFEELYFRILDKEKHEPGRVNRIEGIAEDEYFNCPSGKALRDAIEAFQAYQLENPDWFDRECVDNEDEALESDVQCPLLEEMCSVSVMQNVPEYRDAPPVFINTAEEMKDAKDIVYLTPLINDGDGQELVFTHPSAHLEWSQDYSVQPLAHISESHIYTVSSSSQLYANHIYSVSPAASVDDSQVLSVHPAAQLEENQAYFGQQTSHLEGSQVHSLHPALDVSAVSGAVSQNDLPNVEMEPSGCSRHQEMLARPRLLVEEHDEELVSLNGHSADELESQVPLQQSLAPVASPPVSSVEEELSYEQEESSDWAHACVWMRPLSGSDQGFVSRTPPQHGFSLREDFPDHLDTLSMLQKAVSQPKATRSLCKPRQKINPEVCFTSLS